MDYVACPKSPVTHTFYSERIAGANNSYSCKINGHMELILLYKMLLTSKTSLLQLHWLP